MTAWEAAAIWGSLALAVAVGVGVNLVMFAVWDRRRQREHLARMAAIADEHFTKWPPAPGSWRDPDLRLQEG